MSSTPSSTVASASSTSPIATATTERLKRFPARAGGDPSRRPASIAPSKPAASASSRARTRSWAGSGTGGTRDRLALSHEPARGHDSACARWPRRSGRGRAQRQRARTPRRVGARARRRTAHRRMLRLPPAGSSHVSRSGHGGCQRGHGKGRRPEGCISHHLRVGHGTPGPVRHRLVSRAVELVERQFDQQLDRLDGGQVRQAAKGPHQTGGRPRTARADAPPAHAVATVVRRVLDCSGTIAIASSSAS